MVNMALVYKQDNYLSSKQFAELVGVSIHQIRRWDDAGKLTPVEKTPCGKRYYLLEQAGEALLLKNSMRKRKVGEENVEDSSNSK